MERKGFGEKTVAVVEGTESSGGADESGRGLDCSRLVDLF